MNQINPEQSKNLTAHVIVHVWDTSIETKESKETRTRP